MFTKFLFPRNYGERMFSGVLFLLRVVFGALLMSHGIAKLANFEQMAGVFPDVIGIGSGASLGLAVFAEVFCAAAFILGLLFRLSTIPLIVTMAVAFIGVHGGSIAEGELAFAYLMVFLITYIAGPGRYSLDSLLARYLRCDNK